LRIPQDNSLIFKRLLEVWRFIIDFHIKREVSLQLSIRKGSFDREDTYIYPWYNWFKNILVISKGRKRWVLLVNVNRVELIILISWYWVLKLFIESKSLIYWFLMRPVRGIIGDFQIELMLSLIVSISQDYKYLVFTQLVPFLSMKNEMISKNIRKLLNLRRVRIKLYINWRTLRIYKRRKQVLKRIVEPELEVWKHCIWIYKVGWSIENG